MESEKTEQLRSLINHHQSREKLDLAYSLIKEGANPNTKKYGTTILRTVVDADNVNLLESFVKLGCDIHSKDSLGHKPIDRAISSSLVKIVDWFLSNGIDVNETTSKGGKRIHSVCARAFYDFELDNKNNPIEIAKVFIKHGANLHEKDSFCDKTPLEWALYYNHPDGYDNPFVSFLKKEETKYKPVFSTIDEQKLSLKNEIIELEKAKQKLVRELVSIEESLMLKENLVNSLVQQKT